MRPRSSVTSYSVCLLGIAAAEMDIDRDFSQLGNGEMLGGEPAPIALSKRRRSNRNLKPATRIRSALYGETVVGRAGTRIKGDLTENLGRFVFA